MTITELERTLDKMIVERQGTTDLQAQIELGLLTALKDRFIAAKQQLAEELKREPGKDGGAA